MVEDSRPSTNDEEIVEDAGPSLKGTEKKEKVSPIPYDISISYYTNTSSRMTDEQKTAVDLKDIRAKHLRDQAADRSVLNPLPDVVLNK